MRHLVFCSMLALAEVLRRQGKDVQAVIASAMPPRYRFLDTDGQIIAGLHAAGELVGGLFYFNYPGGTGLMAGSVFGKIAFTLAWNSFRGRYPACSMSSSHFAGSLISLIAMPAPPARVCTLFRAGSPHTMISTILMAGVVWLRHSSRPPAM